MHTLILHCNGRISLVDSVVGSFSVSCLFRMDEDGFQWAFSGVYGPIENRLENPFGKSLVQSRAFGMVLGALVAISKKFSFPIKI